MAEPLTDAPAGTRHLSELCRLGDLAAVLARLPHLPVSLAGRDIDRVDGDGRTALHWAVGMRSWALAQALLAAPHSASAHTADADGVTPFMSACAVNAPPELLASLIGDDDDAAAAAAAIAKADAAGNTALLLAASKAHVGVVRWLLQRGAPLEAQNRQGQNALHRAVGRGSIELAEELLLAARRSLTLPGAFQRFVNASDAKGDTPLHYAGAESNQEMGQLLLRNGSDRDRRNKDGKQFWEL